MKNLELLAASDADVSASAQWAELLFDQALLAEGVVKDPAKLVRRIQDLLTEVSSAAVAEALSERLPTANVPWYGHPAGVVGPPSMCSAREAS